MKIFHSFKQFPKDRSSVALTIGNFDGVHLGHQAILNRLKKLNKVPVVFTFSNHPSEVLQKTPITRLTTLSHRLTLFEQLGTAYTILTPFTLAFSKQTAQEFLSNLKNFIPFSYLILGHDAIVGSDRQKDLSSLAKELKFTLEYLEPVQTNGQIISSSAIRQYILAGKLEEASRLLGRPYSISATVQYGQGKGRELGFHTANLPVEELALPPLGVYAVEVKIGSETHFAVANLGRAPTLHHQRPVCLEVHLINSNRNLYGQELEVFPLKYLRPEKHFPNIEALKTQIQQDIQHAQELSLIKH